MNKRHTAVRIAAALVSGCLAAVAVSQSSGPAAAVQSSVEAMSQQQSLRVGVRMASVNTLRIIAARAFVDAAHAQLVASENHTDGEATRESLTNAMALVNADLTHTATDLLAFPVSSDEPGNTASNSKIASFLASGMKDFSRLSSDLAILAAAQSEVGSSVAARTAELQEAARRATESYHLTVWTSGFQTQLNACRGAVSLTSEYGVKVIGERWECGGSRIPRPGSLVTLSGTYAGVYRVGPTVAVLSAYSDSSRDIPRGYPLLYQTCRNGNARTETFAELIPVG